MVKNRAAANSIRHPSETLAVVIQHPLQANTTRQSLTWNLQGKRKRERPRNNWRRYLDADA
ncbi:hypothetical protein DPMN_107513 [Dreissena polymorpha]|uniref:Uncharacterized protein n=1 Tax=Dreissena polymorpha TaxID=45954 RepID=A0A9D4QK86_DREPO|nr:hypothetical protein DPMN_107513 [Dreissena polymorpha]